MSIWWNGKDQYFKIIGSSSQPGSIWVQYMNIKTNVIYNCYQEAFRARFREITNVKSCRRITGG